MTLTYENSKGEETKVCDISSIDEVSGAIESHIKKLNPDYEIPYVRISANRDERTLIYDVGSHTEFFYLKGVPDEGLARVFKRRA